jgi:hypothetical protein
MNAAQREAMEKSCHVLGGLQAMLDDNPLFCSKSRRENFAEEIRDRLASSTAPASSWYAQVRRSRKVKVHSLHCFC